MGAMGSQHKFRGISTVSRSKGQQKTEHLKRTSAFTFLCLTQEESELFSVFWDDSGRINTLTYCV